MPKKKIAILGGGVGSLTAAYYLTRTPELREQHDVTLYQMGFRVGGKGASGRSMVPDEHFRIEEHGLHLWFGFYDNAFRTIKEVYDRKPALPDDRLITWRDAFSPSSFTPLGEDYAGKLGYWPFVWPTNLDVPGGELELSPLGALSQLTSIVRRVALQMLSGHPDASPLHRLVRGIVDTLEAAELTALLAALEVLEDLADWTIDRLAGHHAIIDAAINTVRKHLQRRAEERLDDDTFRRYFSIFDLGLTVILGVLDPKYGVVTDPEFDLDKLDHLEFRAFLLENGGDPWVVNESSYLRALYDLPFAYEDGDIAKPGLGAGTAIRIVLRIILTYKEACFFEMQAGMGEAVVAPMYEVLRQQGVKVEFFHKVRRLELSPDQRWVQRVHMDRQVDLVSGAYEPTFRVRGVTCWPSEPFWDQIVDGAAIRARLAAQKSSLESHWCTEKVGDVSLELGVDFDVVLLGIALGAFKKLNAEPTMCDELYAANPRFAAMADGLGLVPTQSFQLWTKPDLRGLGFAHADLGRPAMDGAPEPYSVWADCSQVLPREAWPTGDAPGGVFYFCGPWKNDLTTRPSTDTHVPAQSFVEVKANARSWLDQYVGYMWPDAKSPVDPAGLDYDVLYDPQHRAGVARLDYQWIRPNVDPTECCETSLPNTTHLRLKAHESGFENLVLAGAWLRTGINATCVEAATMSGMDAARAICGEPKQIVGEWFCMRRPPDAR